MKRRMPTRPSQRAIRNAMAFAASGTQMEQAVKRGPRGHQPESKINAAVKEWRQRRPDVTIYRNNVGCMEWKPGAWLRYGLCNGSSDFIGYQSVTVSPGMVGKKIAVFLALESKTEDGVLSADQLAFIESVRDAGGKAGVVRSADDCEKLLNT